MLEDWRRIRTEPNGEEARKLATVSVRYIVDDVDAAIAFYRDDLGFTEIMHPAPVFAMLSRGDLRLMLSHAGRRLPRPGDRNRFSIEVTDLAGTVDRLRADGAKFRNEIVTGVGGRQILVFEPTTPEARLEQRSSGEFSGRSVDPGPGGS